MKSKWFLCVIAVISIGWVMVVGKWAILLRYWGVSGRKWPHRRLTPPPFVFGRWVVRIIIYFFTLYGRFRYEFPTLIGPDTYISITYRMLIEKLRHRYFHYNGRVGKMAYSYPLSGEVDSHIRAMCVFGRPSSAEENHTAYYHKATNGILSF